MSIQSLKHNLSSNIKFFEKIGLGESYTSLLLGIVVVILGTILLVSFGRSARLKDFKPPTQAISSDKIQKALEAKDSATSISASKAEYTINPGDSLWTISEKYYKSGYNWVDIAKANKLENPGLLFVGSKLVIPSVDRKILTKTVETQEPVVLASVKSITEDTYSVVVGDDLWDIAVRAYGDGFKWVDIAKANDLSNPNLIHSGNILKIPRSS